METKRRQVIEEDLANVEFETSEDVEVVPTFDSMGLREDLLRGIYAYGKRWNLDNKKEIEYPRLNLSDKFWLIMLLQFWLNCSIYLGFF